MDSHLPFGAPDSSHGATARRLRIAKTFAPGHDGTRRLAREFGDRLVCVRHRYDDANALRVTTVKIVAQVDPLTAAPRLPATPSRRGRPCGSAWRPTSARCAASCWMQADDGIASSSCGQPRGGSLRGLPFKTG